MVGLETWWGKRAARAGRASMTNPQATLPYTDQVHLIDLYKDIGLATHFVVHRCYSPPLYTQTSTLLSTQQTRVLLFHKYYGGFLSRRRQTSVFNNNKLLYEIHRCPQYQYVRRCLEYCPCKLLSHWPIDNVLYSITQMFEHVQSVNLRQKALFDAGQKKQEAAGPIVNWKQREEGLATM